VALFSKISIELGSMQNKVKSVNTPLRTRTPALEIDEFQGILNDLKKLDLVGRPILGDRTNVEEAMRKAQNDAKKDDASHKTATKEVIELSDSEDGSIPPPFLTPKAHRLAKLTSKASDATTNAALSELVRQFIEVLQCNSSRTLTKEAFHFLDVLYKQLADPSIFVTPLRYAFYIPEAHVFQYFGAGRRVNGPTESWLKARRLRT
jgi:casein kinase 1